MRLPLIPITILLVISLLVDLAVFRPMLSKTGMRRWRRGFDFATIALNLALLAVVAFPKKSSDDAGLVGLMWILFTYISVFLPKLMAAVVILIKKLLSKLLHKPLRWLTAVGLGIGVAFFSAMWWGAFVTRHSIDVKEVEVDIAGLPPTFNGYRIAQISDIHCGTYCNDTTHLAKLAERINELQPDLIVFTGDIVNRHSSELRPFINTLDKLSATDGVYSVMGNHDYGDYYSWKSEQQKIDDIASLQIMQRKMGWQMLNNSHVWLRHGNDSIALIGVENIGDPPFHVYGSLQTAYPDVADAATKILLSHNPAHWVDSIADNSRANIALTLSGHTHAMQMEIFGWSPSALRYPTWSGLYTDTLGRHLYVNVGIGTVGFPSRIGAAPEVTIFTLKSK